MSHLSSAIHCVTSGNKEDYSCVTIHAEFASSNAPDKEAQERQDMKLRGLCFEFGIDINGLRIEAIFGSVDDPTF
jgi:hypothetical protein